MMAKRIEIPEKSDLWVVAATYGAVLVVFAPVLLWLAKATGQSEQLRQAFVILAGIGGFLAWENWKKLTLSWEHDRVSVGLLVGSAVLLGLNMIWALAALVLLALLLSVAALLRFTFGSRVTYATRALLLAFGAFTLLVLYLPVLDWPLRVLAGKWAGLILELLGGHISLYVVQKPTVQLVLQSQGHQFVVAPECNGFGLLSSSLLLMIALGIYRRLVALDFVLLFFGAGLIALCFNTLRIVCIVLLAPHVSDYHVMHEIVGIFFMYAGLGLVGWLVWTCPKRAFTES